MDIALLTVSSVLYNPHLAARSRIYLLHGTDPPLSSWIMGHDKPPRPVCESLIRTLALGVPEDTRDIGCVRNSVDFPLIYIIPSFNRNALLHLQRPPEVHRRVVFPQMHPFAPSREDDRGKKNLPPPECHQGRTGALYPLTLVRSTNAHYMPTDQLTPEHLDIYQWCCAQRGTGF